MQKTAIEKGNYAKIKNKYFAMFCGILINFLIIFKNSLNLGNSKMIDWWD